MPENKKKKRENDSNQKRAGVQKEIADNQIASVPLLILLAGFTILCFFPVLKNGFTNWDDIDYVTQNPLLFGPDWKGIFTQPVSSNYHPLTILSLALNFQLFQLNPFSYVLFNLLLHVANVLLVYFFIMLISEKKVWVAFFTALLFAIHPMHVESVAWISERKDVLYTLFFLLSLIQYWWYLNSGKKINYWGCFLFFVLSLLSKPSAIILPLVLFLLDYWKGRAFNMKQIMEKIPFLLVSLLFGIILLKMQSPKAMAGLDVYPMWSRLLFACYVLMIYIARFFIPYPLSAFHPYPDLNQLSTLMLISPFFIVLLFIFLWRQRKNKLVIFGMLFFIVNLLLVLQVVSIGYAIVAERYTYVPYIGLAFIGCMWINNYNKKKATVYGWALPALAAILFSILTFQRTKIWKDSGRLWTDVIRHYPKSPVPRSNRADFLYKQAKEPEFASKANSYFQQALEDCNIAIKGDAGLYQVYLTRGLIFLEFKRYQEALSDGDYLIQSYERVPDEFSMIYSIRGTAYLNLNNYQQAIADFTTRLRYDPLDDVALNNRGSSYYNGFQKYEEALADFEKAIAIKPLGDYYINRMRCHYKLGHLEQAKSDAIISIEKGMNVPEVYRKQFNL